MADMFDDIQRAMREAPRYDGPDLFMVSSKVPSGFWRQWMTNGKLIVWIPRRAYDTLRLRSRSSTPRAPYFGVPVVLDD